ncbi:hypothetical protein [Bacillus altitudinis]|uniref:hypothetical protein n=1 Tax=Bacillus altitudinis TaxID=293387 RepID=UPI002DBD71B0|nr:hypothetical protein [Bacillus altitudinis]MEC3813983.1 hypothetical protein [Bacillus altitudinis]
MTKRDISTGVQLRYFETNPEIAMAKKIGPNRHKMTLLVLCSSVCLFFNPAIFVGGMWQLYF